MDKENEQVEVAFKVRELERLLSEGKITLEQYLDTRTRIEKLATSSENLQPTEKIPIYAAKAQPSDVKEPKKPYTKMFLGVVLCTIILVGGFFAWSYLNPVYAESLTVESYSVKLFTKGAILFELKNTGNTEVRISKVKMNGYLNQSIEGWNQGWNGTTILQPGQTGVLYVYLFCYFHVLNASMPQLSSPPSQTEIENLYLWMESFNCTFAIVTNTEHQYNCTVPGLTSTFAFAAWMGTLTFTFTSTEQLIITSVTFLSDNHINITMRNTGTAPITIIEIWVNNVKTWSGNSIIDANYQETITLDVAWVTGNNYQFKIITSKGNQFYYTATAPS
ncbi:MAG: hypothetical protein ACPLYF_03705 [Fervidobacterium sp.]